MAVVIETTLGDITVDLYLEQRPATCLNFLKLCKMKYYNFNLFHSIRSGFIAQTGDPTGEGSGGESIWGLLEGSSKRFFSGEKMPKIRHTDAGLLSMVCTDNMMVGSQFFFTLAPDLDSLDGVHCVIGEVTEGHEVLTKLNEVICDETHRPYQDVRITHTVVLEDPFNDLPGLRPPSRSPSPNAERLRGGRIAPDEEIDETQGKSHEEVQEMIEEKEAKARATILEIVGDLPDADIAPPENVLFVCKLNPVTTDDDLEIIFSRFGKIVSCEVIRDKKTGDSLQYAFIEFEDKKSCEDAYFKMDNVLIDDRRIHVDFSQSVSKMRWLGKGRGVQYFNDNNTKSNESMNNKSKRSHSQERNDSRRQHYRDREHRVRDSKHRNDKKSSDLRRERDRSRSRSRRDKEVSRSKHSRGDRTENDRDCSRESNRKKHYKNDYLNSHKNDRKHDNNEKPEKLMQSSPDRNNRREHTISPVRNEKKDTDRRKNYKKEKSNDRHTTDSHKTSKRNERDKSHQKEHGDTTHSTNSCKSKRTKDHSKTNSGEVSEAGPHTPSPVVNESNIKTKRSDKTKKQKKVKNNIKKNKKRRKPSTSSSESDTSDSSSSTGESSSSSEDHKKKKKLKGRKRRHSSSSSSTSSSSSSSDSSSSSSSSSSDSSASSSESEDGKRKRKKNGNKKSGKKTKKL